MQENKKYLKTLLGNLSKEMPYKWRVQSFSKRSPMATVVPYIDSRTVMDTLDSNCEYGWHREHTEVDGKVYCRIGVVMPDGSVMWRSDTGDETDIEGTKGESSDSFKRAAVNWGVGRFLYGMGARYVKASEAKQGGNYPHVVDDHGAKVYDLTEFVNGGGAFDNPMMKRKAEAAAKVDTKEKNTKEPDKPAQDLNKDWQKIKKSFKDISFPDVIREQVEIRRTKYPDIQVHSTIDWFAKKQDPKIIREIYDKLSA